MAPWSPQQRESNVDTKTGHEDADTEVLLALRDNLVSGLQVVAGHFERGTAEISKKEGAAPPSQSGWLTLILLLGIEDELETRVRGFERAISPKLIS